MAAAVRQDFTLRSGRDVRLEFSISADPGQTLADAEVIFGMSRHAGSSNFVVHRSVGNGVTITPPLGLTIELTAEDTHLLDGKYYYEAMVITEEGKKITLTYGIVTVKDSLIGEASL